jgi:hypothetical protein
MLAMVHLYHTGAGPSTLPGVSLLDRTYSRMARVPFFEDGWGELTPLRWRARPEPIDVVWGELERRRGHVQQEGTFRSPNADHLPPAAQTARVLLVTRDGDHKGPAVVHMAATGDEGYRRRLVSLARPLLARGVSSVILENPYYGARRPKGQTGVSIRTVADLLHMGTGSILEGVALVEWLARSGFGPVGVTGVSMGGQMAATIAALVEQPIAAVPCLPSHSATVVFCEGLLSRGVVWSALGPTETSARRRLRTLLEDTDIRMLAPPRKPEASILFGARKDRYVPTHSVQSLHNHWGGQLRWLECGHVRAFVSKRRAFMDGIVEALGEVS